MFRVERPFRFKVEKHKKQHRRKYRLDIIYRWGFGLSHNADNGGGSKREATASSVFFNHVSEYRTSGLLNTLPSISRGLEHFFTPRRRHTSPAISTQNGSSPFFKAVLGIALAAHLILNPTKKYINIHSR